MLLKEGITATVTVKEHRPMNTTTLGTWRKPPLAYVVAELVISPYYSLAAKVPGLQDRQIGRAHV